MAALSGHRVTDGGKSRPLDLEGLKINRWYPRGKRFDSKLHISQ